jgi:hypothetical protein
MEIPRPAFEEEAEAVRHHPQHGHLQEHAHGDDIPAMVPGRLQAQAKSPLLGRFSGLTQGEPPLAQAYVGFA